MKFQGNTLTKIIFIMALTIVTISQNACGLKKSSKKNMSLSCDSTLLATFEKGWKPFLTTNCATCHVPGGAGKGAFASSDLGTAYSAFNTATSAKVSQYAVDPNHQPPYSGSQHTATVNALTAEWDASVNNYAACLSGSTGTAPVPTPTPSGPRVVTVNKSIGGGVAVPQCAPAGNVNKTISFNLGTEIASGTAIPGATFTVDVCTPTSGPGYVFTSPKLTTGGSAVKVVDIRPNINSQMIATATTWTTVNTVVPAGTSNQVLGTGAMLISMTANPNTDIVSWSFGALETTTGTTVAPTLTQLRNGVFAAKCTSCHTNGNADGGLNLNDYASITSNNRAVPFNAAGSKIVQDVEKPAGTNGQMPPSGARLTAGEIQQIKDWVNAGAQNN